MANVITGIRIICALALIFCPVFSILFYVFYILGGVSDIIDGAVARKLGKETKFGGQFDTVADIVFFTVAVVKFLRAVYIPSLLIIWISCIALTKVISILCGFIRYKQFVSVHSVINKICGILLFAIPLLGKLSPLPLMILIAVTCIMATFAAAWELHCVIKGI